MAGLSGCSWRIAPSPKYSSPILMGGNSNGIAALAIR
jgi:hypothetical protein